MKYTHGIMLSFGYALGLRLWFNLISASRSSDIKVTAFKHMKSTGLLSQHDICKSRGIIRCAEQCARDNCLSFSIPSRIGQCRLYQKMSHCVTEDKFGGVDDNITKESLPLLLLFPVRLNSERRIQQVQIGNWSTSTYPLMINLINAITYIPWKRKLWVAPSIHQHVKSFPLYGTTPEIILKGLQVFKFGLDKGRQLVFMATTRPNKAVVRVNELGLETVFVNQDSIREIAVDSRGKMVIIGIKGLSKFKVVSMDYDGKKRNDILKTKEDAVDFSYFKEGQLLYFCSQNWLRRIKLKRNYVGNILRSSQIRAIASGQTKLFRLMKSGQVISYDLKKRERRHIANVMFSEPVWIHLKLCVLR